VKLEQEKCNLAYESISIAVEVSLYGTTNHLLIAILPEEKGEPTFETL
jgi:hypothetical protein